MSLPPFIIAELARARHEQLIREAEQDRLGRQSGRAGQDEPLSRRRTLLRALRERALRRDNGDPSASSEQATCARGPSGGVPAGAASTTTRLDRETPTPAGPPEQPVGQRGPSDMCCARRP